MASSFVGGIGRDRIREYFTKKTKRVDAEEDVRRHRSTSTSRHRHHHHHHPSLPKKKTPSPSSSYLIERELYALDVGRMTDWLMLLGKKVEAVNGKLTEQERMLAEDGPGVTVAVQDEEGRRYCPLWRRRRGSNSYMFCGRGWTNLAEDHGLRVGDVLRFLTCPGKDREGTGKLYLGIQVVRVDDKVPGGRGTRRPHTLKRKRNTSTASDDHRHSKRLIIRDTIAIPTALETVYVSGGHGDDHESEGTSSTRHHHNRCSLLESLGFSWRRHGPRTSRRRSCNTWRLVPPLLLPSPLQPANSGRHTNPTLLPCP